MIFTLFYNGTFQCVYLLYLIVFMYNFTAHQENQLNSKNRNSLNKDYDEIIYIFLLTQVMIVPLQNSHSNNTELPKLQKPWQRHRNTHTYIQTDRQSTNYPSTKAQKTKGMPRVVFYLKLWRKSRLKFHSIIYSFIGMALAVIYKFKRERDASVLYITRVFVCKSVRLSVCTFI